MRFIPILIALLLFHAIRVHCQIGCDIQDQCGNLPVCGGPPPGSPTFFCEGETVSFTNCTDPSLVDMTIICWGDGACDTFPGPPVLMTHAYDFSFDTCLVTSQALQIAITMTVINECPTGISQNCLITFIKIKVDPVADFLIPDYICQGEEALFINTTCENADTATYEWYVDGVYQGFAVDLPYIFNTPGLHDVLLIAENECGPDTTTYQINVLDQPIAEAAFTLEPMSGCTDLTVCFENLSQGGAVSLHWIFPSGSAISFPDSATAPPCDTIATFLEEGEYEVFLIAENPCGIDTFQMIIPVFGPPFVSLQAVQPACQELYYTPEVTFSGEITSWQWYFENGIPDTSSIANPDSIYFDTSGNVTLIVSGPCGVDTVVQSVEILNQDINLPDIVDTICTTAEPFNLTASPTGSWSSPTANFVTPEGQVNPSNGQSGWNTLVYSINFSGCEKFDSLQIYILETPEVNIGAPETLCQTTGEYQLTFSPDGGQWIGDGITNPDLGVFNTYAVTGPAPYLLQYTYTDPVNGCVTSMEKTITLMETPSVLVEDTIYTCAIMGDIDLNTFIGPVYSPPPSPGQVSWGGGGVDSAGIFNSGGVADTFEISIHYNIPPGCDTTVSLILILTELSQPNAGPDLEVCQNDTLILTGAPSYPYPYAQWSGNEIDPETGKVNLNNLTSPGTYVFTYIVFPGTPCESNDEVSVVLHPAGGVSVAETVYACETDSAVALPDPEPPLPVGAWAGPAVMNGNQVNIQNLAPIVGSHTYVYTVPTLPNACNYDELELIVEAQPTAAFTLPDTGCVNDSICFISQDLGEVTYFWDFGDPNSSTNTSTDPHPCHLYSQPGDYTITLEVTTENPLTGDVLCSNSTTGMIHIIEPPTVAFTADITEGCGPLTISIENISAGEGLTYFWNWVLDTSSAEQPGPITFPLVLEETNYPVVLSVENICATVTATADITVHPHPQASFGVTNQEPCSGMFVEVNNTSTGGPNNYTWILNGDTISTNLNPDPIQFFTGNQASTSILQLFAENDCGVDSTELVITTIPTDVIALFNMSDTVICVGDTLLLTSFPTPGGIFHWEIPNVGSNLGSPVSQVFYEEGEYEIILYVEGCGYDSMSRYVKVLPLPEVGLEYDPTVCKNTPVEFEVLSNAAKDTLYFGDGTFSDITISQHTYDSSGTFPLLVTAISSGGCRNIWTGSIEVVEPPTAVYTPPDPICANETATFESESIGVMTCLWDFGDISSIQQGCTLSHQFPVGDTSYSVSLIVISDEGCRDTVSHLFYVQKTPDAYFTYTILEPCTPGLVVFEDASDQSPSIQWSFGGSQFMAEMVYPLAGEYTVTLQALNGDCEDTHTETFTILQGPSLEYEVDPHCTVQEGSDLHISTLSLSDFVTVSGENYEGTGNFHQNLLAGLYTITAQAANGCKETVEATVLSPNEIYAALAEDTFYIIQGEIIQLQLEYNQSGLFFEWTPLSWLNNPYIPNPVVRPYETITYLVAISDSLGCTKYDTAYIQVREDRDTTIYLPNTFTPDNNGFNDVFMLRSNNPGLFQIKSFLIYDIHGALVFESRDCQANVPSCGWDGTFRGKPAFQGVYRWQYELEFIDGYIDRAEGTLLLMR